MKYTERRAAGGKDRGNDATHPGALVRGPGLSHRLRVMQLVHVTLELLHVLLQLPIFPQLLSQNVHKCLERRFWQLVVPTRACVERSRRPCPRGVVA